MRLYELTQAYNGVYELLADEESNLDCLEDTLQSIEGEIEVKAEGLGKLVQMLQHDAGRIEDEAARLQDMADKLKEKHKARLHRILRVKNYLRQQMELMGKDKIKTPLFTIWIQETKSVDDFAPGLIPAEYQQIKYSADKVRILAALKAGKEVPGCVIKTTAGLRIK